MNLDS